MYKGDFKQEAAEVVLRVDLEVDPAAITTAGRFASCEKRRGSDPHGTNQAIVKEQSMAGGRIWLRMIPWACSSSTMKATK
ncbi:unnamed protein product [Blumeria hordei]|uniref:Uncharacterized protein n=1 Tax=Blumeria hordei TaxID=2867405 RepID=A0A383URD3_BLUHO|nr:unnamed protein product [Blumeria hordei]